MDESTDISDTAQLAVFARAINDNFEIIEELLELESMHETAKGIDQFQALEVVCRKK